MTVDKNTVFENSHKKNKWRKFEFSFILASLPTFATIPTCVVGGLMGQAFGRRLSLLLVAPIFAVSFILQAIASEVAMFQFGRFLSGIAGGLVSGPASVNCTTYYKSHSRTKSLKRPHWHIDLFFLRPMSAKFLIRIGGRPYVPGWAWCTL